MCKTRYEWTLIDFATWFAGAVLVPIYETSAPPRRCSGTSATRARSRIIVETADHFARFDEVHADLPADPQRLADRPRRPRQARGIAAPTCPTRRSSAAATSRTGSDIATLIYTVGLDRASPRAACSRTRTSSSCAATRRLALHEVVRARRVDAAVHHHGAHLRPLHRGARACTPACKVGHQPDTKQLLPALGELQADLPPRRAARVREGLQLVGAEGRGRRQGQDLPRRRRGRRRALEGRRGRQRCRSA